MDSVYGFYGFSVWILWIYTDMDLIRAYDGLADGSRYTNAVYFFIGARRIVLFGAGRYENGYARARTLAKQCLENRVQNRRRLDVQAIRGHMQMTEVDTPSGLGVWVRTTLRKMDWRI